MVGYRVHLFELSHVDVTESTCLAFGLRNLSSSCVDATKGSFCVSILLFLGFSFRLHLCLDPRRLLPNRVHHLLRLIAQGGLGTKIKVEGRGAQFRIARAGP
jgi:hypothetical protein